MDNKIVDKPPQKKTRAILGIKKTSRSESSEKSKSYSKTSPRRQRSHQDRFSPDEGRGSSNRGSSFRPTRRSYEQPFRSRRDEKYLKPEAPSTLSQNDQGESPRTPKERFAQGTSSFKPYKKGPKNLGRESRARSFQGRESSGRPVRKGDIHRSRGFRSSDARNESSAGQEGLKKRTRSNHLGDFVREEREFGPTPKSPKTAFSQDTKISYEESLAPYKKNSPEALRSILEEILDLKW